MASTSAVSMALPLTRASQNKVPINSEAFFKPLPVKQPSTAVAAARRANGRLQVKASSLKEKAVAGLTAAAMTTSMVIPEVAQAADGVTPSLKNFLLSIVAGGIVVTAIVGAVIGVANFDPVKRS